MPRDRLMLSVLRRIGAVVLVLATAACAETIALKPGSQSYATARNLAEDREADQAKVYFRRAIADAESDRIADRARIGLGRLLLQDTGRTEADVREAVALTTEAAARDASAKRDLAMLYLDGGVVPEDPVRAAQLLREAAQVSPATALQLAELIAEGRIPEATPDERSTLLADAVSDLKIAERRGSGSAAGQLGQVVAKTDPNQGEELLRRAIERGQRGAILPLAELWFDSGIPADQDRAEALLLRSIDAGEVSAATSLAERRRDAGEVEEAAQLYALAARARQPAGYLGLASLMLDPDLRLTPDTASSGVVLLEQGSNTNPEVALALGRITEQGKYVSVDERRAARLYQTAADAGLATGALRYGRLLKTGRGVSRDPARAIAYLQTASDAGESGAWADLGEMY
ncbi:MAG: tetratricopeptide repeat protein, partial [Pseudomonadota bacterium]